MWRLPGCKSHNFILEEKSEKENILALLMGKIQINPELEVAGLVWKLLLFITQVSPLYEADAYTSITSVVNNTVTFAFHPFVAQGTCWVSAHLALPFTS